MNLFNLISFDWNKRKILKSVKNSPFIKPKCYFRFTKDYVPFMFCTHYGKFLSIVINDLEWKDKWNIPRHEEDPYISIWKLPEELESTISSNEDYWEQILWYLYYTSYNRKKKVMTN